MPGDLVLDDLTKQAARRLSTFRACAGMHGTTEEAIEALVDLIRFLIRREVPDARHP